MTKNVAAAFVKAQRAFGPALKTNTNPHFKSKYADLSVCVEAVIDALNQNGIALIQMTHPDETGVTVETVLLHESGEQIVSGKLHVPAAKQDPQGYGSALTYARRYSLMAACGIAPEDDDGNAAKGPAKAGSRPDIPTPNQPGVMQMVTASEAADLSPETRAYLNELADTIKTNFPQSGPKVASERIDLEKLEIGELLYLTMQLPVPMRNAIKAASVAARRVGMPA